MISADEVEDLIKAFNRIGEALESVAEAINNKEKN